MSTKQKPAPPARPIAKPKAMSSKLLTMKFMQRSASSPTSSRTDALAAREALVQESAKRDAALQARERSSASAAETGDAETRWELSYVTKIDADACAGVVGWGYGELVDTTEDEEEEEEEEEGEEGEEGRRGGRMVFGRFRSRADPPKEEEKDGDAEDEDGAPQRKNVSLRGLTSISNAGPPSQAMVCRGCGGKGHTQAKCPQAKCYACDGVGHMAKDCPRPQQKGRKRVQMGGSRGEYKKRRSSGGY